MIRKLVVLSLTAALLGGCTLIVDGQVDGITANAVPDMDLHLENMDPHVGQLTEVWLINNDGGLVQAVAILDPLLVTDIHVQLANVVAPDVRRVDFWSDLNMNGMLDAPMDDPSNPSRQIFPDHQWTLMLDENGNATFMHNTNFTNIVGASSFVGAGPLDVTVTGVGDFTDQPAHVVAWGPSEHEVGSYFLGALSGDTLHVDFNGHAFVDQGTEYRIEITLGSDPQAQPVCTTATATATGLTVSAALTDLQACP